MVLVAHLRGLLGVVGGVSGTLLLLFSLFGLLLLISDDGVWGGGCFRGRGFCFGTCLVLPLDCCCCCGPLLLLPLAPSPFRFLYFRFCIAAAFSPSCNLAQGINRNCVKKPSHWLWKSFQNFRNIRNSWIWPSFHKKPPFKANFCTNFINFWTFVEEKSFISGSFTVVCPKRQTCAINSKTTVGNSREKWICHWGQTFAVLDRQQYTQFCL